MCQVDYHPYLLSLIANLKIVAFRIFGHEIQMRVVTQGNKNILK
jgi:hypothetical protein